MLNSTMLKLLRRLMILLMEENLTEDPLDLTVLVRGKDLREVKEDREALEEDKEVSEEVREALEEVREVSEEIEELQETLETREWI